MIRAPILFALAASLLLGACQMYYCCEKDREKERAWESRGFVAPTSPDHLMGHQTTGPVSTDNGFFGIQPCSAVNDSDRYHADPYPHQPCEQPAKPTYWYP